MLPFIELIRIRNLMIIALTQYLLRYCILKPILQINDLELQFSALNFFLLVLSTIMIAAAGYIINDYFDVNVDRKNDPSRVIVGKTVKRRVAMSLHVIFNIIGIGIGFFIAYRVGIIELGYINMICAGILWYYSTTFKHQFLIGNIMIAFLTALVPLMVGLYEIPLIIEQYNEMLVNYMVNFNYHLPNHLISWITGFSLFAFITTLIREIIKDMEDIEGDRAFGSKTLPVKYGIRIAKIISCSMIIFTIILLSYIQFTKLHDQKTFFYFLAAIQLPLFFLVYKIITAIERKDFHFASNLVKMVMITGILYTVLVNYIVVQDL